jgi:S1-C subfamily serine protease
LGYDERRSGKTGVKVVEIFDGTPATKSNLRDDDLITHIDDLPVYDADHLIMRVGSLPVGREIKLTVERASSFRSSRVLETTARLAKKAPESDRLPTVTAGVITWRGMRIDHATAVPGFGNRQYVGRIDTEGCVAIVDVQRDSPAFDAELTQGMFVSHVANQRVSGPEDFYEAVADREGAVRLTVSSDQGGYVTRSVAPQQPGTPQD